MNPKLPTGLFIAGNNTEVGKTWVASAITKSLISSGTRVGVYKPVASGAQLVDGNLISEDIEQLYRASGNCWPRQRICPQLFQAPLAPYLAAEAENRKVDPRLLLDGFEFWKQQQAEGICDLILVEGAGGLMSPLTRSIYNLTLARQMDLPILLVAANRLGVINETLLSIHAANQDLGARARVVGVLVNNVDENLADESRSLNLAELETHCAAYGVPVLSSLPFQSAEFSPPIDWQQFATGCHKTF